MIKDFTIKIDPAIISDLKDRLAHCRWPDEIGNAGWDYGTSRAYLQQLCRYWEKDFDWNRQQAYLNTFAHFTTEVEGFGLHFIHEKAKSGKAIPLLLTHGFPDSFMRFLKLIPLLLRKGEGDLSFDLIVPSIPGYGFSDKAADPGMNPEKIAQLFAGLMKQLGYQKYFAHGGDWGSSITEQLAVQFPEHLYGIHLTDIPYRHLFTIPPGDLTEAEKKYLEAGKQWQMTEGAYAMIQSTKPQSLSYGLNDSPAGLASWIVEKFQRWSDSAGDPERSFTKDELLSNLTIYWATQTISSAMRIYYETLKYPLKKLEGKIKPPAGMALFPKDLISAPKEFADRIYDVMQWTQMPKGGHFAAMEEPELLANDIRSFVGKVNASTAVTTQ